MRVTRAQRITDLYDPESLITGAEVEAGFTYDNSCRDYFLPEYKRIIAITGIEPELLTRFAPRELKDSAFFEKAKDLSYLDETTSFLP